jgi:SAM-dependent MidA family methyltransferase
VLRSGMALCSIHKVSVLAAIQAEIRDKGPITFARFMEMALYSPGGYYERPKQIGRAGDFYTSVSVGPLFGELLARQFSTWFKNGQLTELVEIGAHDGRLARDILSWFLQHEPEAVSKINYCIIEPSPERRIWQKTALSNIKLPVRWQDQLRAGVRGIIFSNELLDALPVHRLRWDARQKCWGEWLVDCEQEKFIWRSGELRQDIQGFVPNVPGELAKVLPDGFSTEISPAAFNWWTNASKSLEKGYLVAIDYGLAEQEFFRPDRSNGTARAYFQHRLADDLLANAGAQDLTAHVNWTMIQRAGENAGLHTDMFFSQEEFLMRIARDIADEKWTAEQIRQLKTLTHPNFLGRAFRVLVQSRVQVL